MKNIHVLPTNQPSRLYLEYGDGDLCLSNNLLPQTSKSNNQHIYITSDEEIKEDYVLVYGVVIKVMMFDEETLYFLNGTKAKRKDCKKIILTTDQDLIKDGVQAIDDEFLEWFVKNPSCEFVETYSLGIQNAKTGESGHYKYEIIIPQEEPKQELPQLGTTEFVNMCENIFSGKPKQETLEEASLRIGLMEIELNHTKTLLASCEKALENRDNQAQRMYSEEEVKEILMKTDRFLRADLDLWFEQFKKN